MKHALRQQAAPLRGGSFRLLFVATSASSVGTLLAAVALAIDVKDRTESGLWVGAVLLAEFLPTIVIGLALGPLLDRLSRRMLVVASDVGRAAVFAALPFVGTPAAIVGLAALAGIANGFFRPAVFAGLPNLVPEAELPQANALLQAVENLSWAVGPVLGGVIVAAAGPHTAYWINAVSFLVSALLLVRIPARALQSAEALSRGHWRDVADGMWAVRRSRALTTVLVVWSLAMLATGTINVAEIFLAKNTFDAGDLGYGVLYGAVGAGLVAGSVLGGAFADRVGVGALYGGAIGVMGLAFVAAAISPNVWVAAALAALAGTGNGIAVACNVLIVQRAVGDDLRGRALTVIMAANYAVLAGATIAAGALVDAVGARWAWGGAGVVLVLAAGLAYTLAPGVAQAAAAPDPTERVLETT